MKRGEFSGSGINPQLFIKYKVMSHKIIYTQTKAHKKDSGLIYVFMYHLCVYQ